MLVQVDEAGRDDEALGVEDALAGKRLRGDARDPALSDADIADGIDARLRIHHAPALKHDVVGLRERRRGEESAKRMRICCTHAALTFKLAGGASLEISTTQRQTPSASRRQTVTERPCVDSSVPLAPGAVVSTVLSM